MPVFLNALALEAQDGQQLLLELELAWLEARHQVVALIRNFKPDLVLISAGFDSRAGDPLGGFTLSDGDFADLTALLLEIAGSYAGGRLVSVLEGGYSLAGLAAAAVAHVEALGG